MDKLSALVYDIETHPIVVAIVLFGIFFLGASFLKKKPSASTPISDTANLALANPNTVEFYKQQFNSYPVVPAPTPVSMPVGTCPSGYHFLPLGQGQPIPSGSKAVIGGYCVPDATTPTPIPTPTPTPTPTPPPKAGVTIHPQPWPNQLSTLSGIAQHYNTTLQHIESLNPWIFEQRHTWDLIYTSDNIRVS